MNMNFRFFGIILALLCTLPSFGQKSTISINPIKLFTFNVLELEYDRVLGESLVIGLNVQGSLPGTGVGVFNTLTLNPDDPNFTLDALRLAGFKITPEIRYFFAGEAPSGFYLGGFVRVAQQAISTNVQGTSGTSQGDADLSLRFLGGGGGIDVGFQKVLGGGFTIDYHFGGGLSFTGTNFNGELNDLDVQEVNDAINSINAELAAQGINYQIDSNDIQQDFSIPLGGSIFPIIRSVLTLGYTF